MKLMENVKLENINLMVCYAATSMECEFVMLLYSQELILHLGFSSCLEMFVCVAQSLSKGLPLSEI